MDTGTVVNGPVLKAIETVEQLKKVQFQSFAHDSKPFDSHMLNLILHFSAPFSRMGTIFGSFSDLPLHTIAKKIPVTKKSVAEHPQTHLP